MPRNGCPLPEYSALIRWTVQDVVNWLSQNGLNGSTSIFRKAGVDGNKLINVTRSDLAGIRCNRKDIEEIVRFVEAVQVPRPTGYNSGSRPTFQHQQDPGYSSDEDDDAGWSDGEFDDGFDDPGEVSDSSNPVPPPRRNGRAPAPAPSISYAQPNRHQSPIQQPVEEENYEDPDINNLNISSHAPPIPGRTAYQPEQEETYEDPDLTPPPPVGRTPPPPVGRRVVPPPQVEPDENYEDPDANLKISSIHGGPLPTPGASKGYQPPPRGNRAPQPQPPPMGNRAPQPQPPPLGRNNVKAPTLPPSRRQQPPPVDTEEVYEEPDAAIPPVVPFSLPRRAVPVPQEEDVYDIPDEEKKKEEQDGDNYLDMSNQPTPPHMIKHPVPSFSHRNQKMPLPTQEPEPEDYEEPDAPKPMPKKSQHRGLPALPVHEDPPRRQMLPPPPTAAAPASRVPPIPNNQPPIPNNHNAPVAENIDVQRWYHGNLSRNEAVSRLKEQNVDGMYLIRKSSQGTDKPYTLQIFYKGDIKNLPIRRRADNMYAIGKEKQDEKCFSTLVEMVNFFKTNFLVLAGGAHTKLVKSLPKT